MKTTTEKTTQSRSTNVQCGSTHGGNHHLSETGGRGRKFYECDGCGTAYTFTQVIRAEGKYFPSGIKIVGRNG